MIGDVESEGRNEGNGTAGGVGEREGGNTFRSASTFGTTAVPLFDASPPSESESEDESDEDVSSLPSSESEDDCPFVFSAEAETGVTVPGPGFVVALLVEGTDASLESESDDEDSLDSAALLFLFRIRFLGAGGLEAAGAIVVGCREKAKIGKGRVSLPHAD